MSGNGEFIPNREEIVLGGNGLPDLPLPAGTGGGCVTSGPFKDLKINLGPVALDVPGGPQETNPAGPLEFDPRCLKRDLTDEVNRRFANACRWLRCCMRFIANRGPLSLDRKQHPKSQGHRHVPTANAGRSWER